MIARGTVIPSRRYMPTGPSATMNVSQNAAAIARPRERASPRSTANATASTSVTTIAQAGVYDTAASNSHAASMGTSARAG